MPALIAMIIGLIAQARGGNDAAASQMTQLGSQLNSMMSSIGSKSKSNPSLSERGYPSSRYGY